MKSENKTSRILCTHVQKCVHKRSKMSWQSFLSAARTGNVSHFSPVRNRIAASAKMTKSQCAVRTRIFFTYTGRSLTVLPRASALCVMVIMTSLYLMRCYFVPRRCADFLQLAGERCAHRKRIRLVVPLGTQRIIQSTITPLHSQINCSVWPVKLFNSFDAYAGVIISFGEMTPAFFSHSEDVRRF